MARETMQAMLALPAPVSRSILGYMGLFRPTERALSWKKARKIVAELAALIAPGHIQIQGKPARPCTAHIWAQGMEQMAARTDLTRPMRNHNYLKQIVWQIADQADAGRELQQRRTETDGTQRVIRTRKEQPEEMSEIMRKAIALHGDPLEKQGGTDAAE